jgi:hypothetical protein
MRRDNFPSSFLGENMTLKDYTDKYGRIHDEPTINGEPSSNNGWLFTAVANKLGHPISVDPIAGLECAAHFIRHPREMKKPTPPISRDEVLGLAYLRFISSSQLDNWNFSPYPIPKFNLMRFLQQAVWLVDWKTLKLKHRNTFWKEGFDQFYRFAFSVPLSDRAAILRWLGKKSNPFYSLIEWITSIKKPKDRSSRLLRFLKTGKDKESVVNYFGKSHPLSQNL